VLRFDTLFRTCLKVSGQAFVPEASDHKRIVTRNGTVYKTPNAEFTGAPSLRVRWNDVLAAILLEFLRG
jgi:hypothetical protein